MRHQFDLILLENQGDSLQRVNFVGLNILQTARVHFLDMVLDVMMNGAIQGIPQIKTADPILIVLIPLCHLITTDGLMTREISFHLSEAEMMCLVPETH
jgi:hypothetical protein